MEGIILQWIETLYDKGGILYAAGGAIVALLCWLIYRKASPEVRDRIIALLRRVKK